MTIIDKLLSEVPLFRHCTHAEKEYLKKISTLSLVKKGSSFDLRKLNTFNVVINGFFEIEALGKSDMVYLSPGSFFGHIPFSDTSLKGRVKAMIDSNLIIFKSEDIYRFFIGHFGAMKGYLKTLSKMGLPLTPAAARYSYINSKIITVTSAEPGSGKTFTASLLASILSRQAKVIAIDMSYSGISLFDCFNAEAAPPFSHRREGQTVNEDFIAERVVTVSENLDLMNFSYGSKVKVDSSVVSPLLFVLSKTYEYIVIDLSAADTGLSEKTFSVSSYLINVIKDRRRIDLAHALSDTYASGFTAVMYLMNLNFESVSGHNGGYLLDKINIQPETPILTLESESLKPLIDRITKKKKVLIVEANYLNSIYLSGFFSALFSSDESFDMLYTSSLSYLPAGIFTASRNADDYKRSIMQAFGDRGLARIFSVEFPEKFVFKAAPLLKFAAELLGDLRIESCGTYAVCKLRNEIDSRQFIACSGRLSELTAASIAIGPLFEAVGVNDRSLSSGYPESRVRIEELFRTDVEKVVYLSLENQTESPVGVKLLPLLNNYIRSTESGAGFDKFSDLADHNIILKAAEGGGKIEKIFENTRQQSIKLLNERNVFR